MDAGASALAPLLDGSSAGELIPELVRHDSARQLLERQRTDQQDRAVRFRQRQYQGAIQVGRNRRLNHGEALATLLANLREGTLENILQILSAI
jgi:hypothetical protein